MPDVGSFQDQIYVDHLREALWSRSTSFASVMVGAGLSLNATPVGGGARSMPTWGELVSKLVDDIYPEGDAASSWHRTNATSSSSTAGGMLRLAEEYEAAFGRDHLEQRLQQFVPDLGFAPSDVHDLLLTLPWRDVLTTNWDTLLERCARRLPERAYQIVATPNDLSRSNQPRIVKLHGSIPHTRPFIVTEEDYRSYPERFAPFVNLVRQAAMETVLCLIGFSGSDPNFLAWTGWVRDQLGPYQPRILLVGMNDYSEAQRLLLERRGVRIVDLSRLPGLDDVPRAQRYGAALRWFLANLHAASSPSDPWDWPDPPSQPPPKGPSGLPPVPSPPSAGYPGTPPPMPPQDGATAWMVACAKSWRAARTTYPGWLVAPEEVRDRVWSNLRFSTFQIARTVADAGPVARLLVLRELLWQLDVVLLPPPDAVHAIVSRTLDELAAAAARAVPEAAPFDAGGMVRLLSSHDACETSDDAARRAAAKELWTNSEAVGSAFVELAFAALRRARETGDDATFDRFHRALAASRAFDAPIWSRLCHERCMMASGRLDRRELMRALAEWDVDGGDPFDGVRRAGALAEAGQVDEADLACSEAIERIRQSRATGRQEVPALSREAWALVLRSHLGLALAHRPGTPADRASSANARRREARRRWRELDALVGSPRSELAGVAASLSSSEAKAELREAHQLLSIRSERPATTTSEALPDGGWRALVPALRVLRLFDVAGLPARVGNVGADADVRRRAIAALGSVAPRLATTAFIRFGQVDGPHDREELLPRTWGAILHSGEAGRLAARARALLRLALGMEAVQRELDEGSSAYWRTRVNFAATLLGRLVGRLPATDVRAIALEAIETFGRLEADHPSMRDGLVEMFDQVMEALPVDDQVSLLAEFAAMPLQSDGPARRSRPEPWFHLQHLRRPPTRASLGAGFDAAVGRLLQAAAGDDAAGSSALRRLAILESLDLLERPEAEVLSSRVWARIGDALPSNELFLDDVLLTLPDVADRDAAGAFRAAYLAPASTDPFDVPDMLRDSRRFSAVVNRLTTVGRATRRVAGREATVPVTGEEARVLAERLLALLGRVADQAEEGLHGFDWEILARQAQLTLADAAVANLDPDDRDAVARTAEALERLGGRGMPVRDARVAMLRLDPDGLAALEVSLDQDLRSHRPTTSGKAMDVVGRWVEGMAALGVGAPPATLQLGVAYAVRDVWPEVIVAALTATVLVLEGLGRQAADGVVEAATAGLSSLESAAEYRRADLEGWSGIGASQLPAVRALSVRLARTLSGMGLADAAPVRRWIEIGRSDPLPEVRRAADGGG